MTTKFVSEDITVLSTSASHFEWTASINELADGGWIVTWADGDHDASSVRMQRYDADGEKVGDEQTLGALYRHLTTATSDGGWLIVGLEYGVGGTMWRYDADGQRVDSGLDTETYFTDVVGLAGGGWVGIEQVYTENGQQLTQQLYDDDGERVGDGTILSAEQGQYDLTMLDDGGWLLSWGASDSRFQQRFASNGTALGDAIEFPSATVSVAALEDGGWVSLLRQGSDMATQRHDASGAEVGSPTTIHTPADASRGNWVVEGLSNGGWVVAWNEEDHGDTSHAPLRAQVFDAEGNAIGRPYEVARYYGYNTNIEALDNGAFVVTWERDVGNAKDVMQRIFRPVEGNESPVASDEEVTLREGRSTSISVLNNDVDHDSDDLLTVESATVITGDASVSITEDGKLLVQDLSVGLKKGQTAEIVIEYTITDGFDIDTGLVNVQVLGQAADGDVMEGSRRADRFVGSEFDESFLGRGGNDYIDSLGGKDFLVGGAGNDTLKGGRGKDTLVGGKGDDKLFGGTGADTFIFSPGDGHDVIRQPSSWGLGERDILDFTSFGFKNVEQVQRLIEIKHGVVIIDLPGKDRLEIFDGLDHPMFFTI